MKKLWSVALILGLIGIGSWGYAGSRGGTAVRTGAAKPVAARAAAPAVALPAPTQTVKNVDVLDVGEGQDLGPVGKYTVVKMSSKNSTTQEIKLIDDETNKVQSAEIPAGLNTIVVNGVVAQDSKTGKLYIVEPGKGVMSIDPGIKPVGNVNSVDPGIKPVDTQSSVDPGIMPVN